MKRFVHELRYSRKITHKNVIRIYDFLYIQGNYAISMEYFPSHTLGSEVVNEKPVELKRAMQFAIDICTGMTVAHQQGIVHRDLKPANILLDSGRVRLTDFGIAQIAGEPSLRIVVALHAGSVLYGNIGAANRLDFTVIGPAVNLVSRVEAVAKALDQPIIVTDDFIRAYGEPMRSLGRHQLRGLALPHELFAPV